MSIGAEVETLQPVERIGTGDDGVALALQFRKRGRVLKVEALTGREDPARWSGGNRGVMLAGQLGNGVVDHLQGGSLGDLRSGGEIRIRQWGRFSRLHIKPRFSKPEYRDGNLERNETDENSESWLKAPAHLEGGSIQLPHALIFAEFRGFRCRHFPFKANTEGPGPRETERGEESAPRRHHAE